MRAPISVVIPTLNAEKALAKSLPTLIEGVQAGLIFELIISDGGSSDQTREMAQEVGAELIEGPASRGGQLRRGAALARADWLLVLHADSILPPGWTNVVADHLKTRTPACFALRFDATGIAPSLVAGWANLRSRLFGMPYGDQGMLLPRRLYEKAGGYPEIPLMEDVALVRRLKTPVSVLPLSVTTSARRYQQDGWLRRGWLNLTTFALYRMGRAPERLVHRYHRSE